ncbi:MAG: hypothetical protein A2288_01305 [Candidatus Moranbacteria bacterium RIFOXYA12_FULL_44_15]|nr:MAG: hypothetical protein A2288_01305 [Candidatus Moranbacteria bacterium RIFOXYA12_FULL_44_15]OGI36190.1 MAG: hypothetical protein A2259_03135 [Candidatus Moranbacteria bacterium RIFOXYA2_FULL_43_15]
MRAKLKDFWGKYEYKIILVAGFVLASVISFEAGVLKGAEMRQKPIIIEKPAENVAGAAVDNSASQNAPGAQNSAQEEKKDPNDINPTQTMPDGRQDCAFIGSKNSNKYHLPTCRYAKNINPENRICFSSQDDAKAKGYLPDKNCVK